MVQHRHSQGACGTFRHSAVLLGTLRCNLCLWQHPIWFQPAAPCKGIMSYTLVGRCWVGGQNVAICGAWARSGSAIGRVGALWDAARGALRCSLHRDSGVARVMSWWVIIFYVMYNPYCVTLISQTLFCSEYCSEYPLILFLQLRCHS